MPHLHHITDQHVICLQISTQLRKHCEHSADQQQSKWSSIVHDKEELRQRVCRAAEVDDAIRTLFALIILPPHMHMPAPYIALRHSDQTL